MTIALIVHGGAGAWRPGSDDDAIKGTTAAVAEVKAKAVTAAAVVTVNADAGSTGAIITAETALQKGSPELIERYRALAEYLVGLGDDVQIKTLKLYFAFKRLKNFVTVVPGSNKKITWNAGADLPAKLFSTVRVSVTASKPVVLPSLAVRRFLALIGTISASKRPAAWPAAVRFWLSRLYSSCAARLMP